jgi:dipeptidyl aminopeptidase/acylaminoacyl peptidase
VPFDGAKKFTERSQKLGNDCQLVTYEGGRHGYFIFDEKLYQTVIAKTEKFLKNKGFFAR